MLLISKINENNFLFEVEEFDVKFNLTFSGTDSILINIEYNIKQNNMIYNISSPGEYEVGQVSFFCYEAMQENEKDPKNYLGKVNLCLIKVGNTNFLFSLVNNLSDLIDHIDFSFLLINTFNLNLLNFFLQNLSIRGIISTVSEIDTKLLSLNFKFNLTKSNVVKIKFTDEKQFNDDVENKSLDLFLLN